MRISWPEGLPPNGALPGPVVSAADLLRGTFDPDDPRGCVVFVGVTDATLGDRVPMPVTKRAPDPGVMVQAAAFHTMESRQYLVGPSTSETLIVVAVLSLLATHSLEVVQKGGGHGSSR